MKRVEGADVAEWRVACGVPWGAVGGRGRAWHTGAASGWVAAAAAARALIAGRQALGHQSSLAPVRETSCPPL